MCIKLGCTVKTHVVNVAAGSLQAGQGEPGVHAHLGGEQAEGYIRFAVLSHG